MLRNLTPTRHLVRVLVLALTGTMLVAIPTLSNAAAGDAFSTNQSGNATNYPDCVPDNAAEVSLDPLSVGFNTVVDLTNGATFGCVPSVADSGATLSYSVGLVTSTPTAVQANGTNIPATQTSGAEPFGSLAVADPTSFTIKPTALPTPSSASFKIIVFVTAHKGDVDNQAISTFIIKFTAQTFECNPINESMIAVSETSTVVEFDATARTGLGLTGGCTNAASYTVSDPTGLPAISGTTCKTATTLDVAMATVGARKATYTAETGYLTPFTAAVSGCPDNAGFTLEATDNLGHTITLPVTINVTPARVCTSSGVSTGVIFNKPNGSDAEQKAIKNTIINLINCAQPNSMIAMSWFSFTDTDVYQALASAIHDGVNVRVLVNVHVTKSVSTSYSMWNKLSGLLGNDAASNTANATPVTSPLTHPTASWIESCPSGCLTRTLVGAKIPSSEEAEYPALHSKFFMFSKVSNGSGGTINNVIGISSVNPTFAQARLGWNNAQIVVGDATLYGSMATYFSDMASVAAGYADRNTMAATSYRKLTDSSGDTVYYTFPRLGPDSTSDNVSMYLKNKVQCTYKNSKGKKKQTEVLVNMFVFTRDSPAMRLWHMAHDPAGKKWGTKWNGGCKITIVYTDMSQAIRAYNTNTKSIQWVKPKGTPVDWGVADCLSTPTKRPGDLTSLQRRVKTDDAGNPIRNAKGKKTYRNVKVCAKGTLQGRMPTINRGGGYCWLKSKSTSGSKGTIKACASTPLNLTELDPADLRAKLEWTTDSAGKSWYTHQKYILIKGMVEGKVQNVVISGTPNVSSPGLRYNDEILTITKNPIITSAYSSNFSSIMREISNRAAPEKKQNLNKAGFPKRGEGAW